MDPATVEKKLAEVAEAAMPDALIDENVIEAKDSMTTMEVKIKQNEKRGWWTEETLIDRIDKAVSMPVFSLSLGPTFETLLSVPGTWFGLPVPAFIMSNLLTWYHHLASQTSADLTWLVDVLGLESSAHWFVQLLHGYGLAAHGSFPFLVASLFFVGVWGVVFMRFWLSGHVEKAYLLNKHWMFPSIGLPVMMGKWYMPTGYKAVTFFIVSWMCAQAVSGALKTLFSRSRPTVARLTAQKLQKVERAFPSYRAMLSISDSAFESFPSGDSVGAACFSAVLFVIKAPMWTVMVCFVTAFGRMYYQAHHFLDVSVGLAIGFLVTLTLDAMFGVAYFDVTHTILATVMFIAFFLTLQKFKPELPAELRVKGRKGF